MGRCLWLRLAPALALGLSGVAPPLKPSVQDPLVLPWWRGTVFDGHCVFGTAFGCAPWLVVVVRCRLRWTLRLGAAFGSLPMAPRGQ